MEIWKKLLLLVALNFLSYCLLFESCLSLTPYYPIDLIPASWSITLSVAIIGVTVILVASMFYPYLRKRVEENK